MFYTVLALFQLMPLLAASDLNLAARHEDERFRRRAMHSVAVLDNYLYVHGGEKYGFNDTVKRNGGSIAENCTLSIPLDIAWKNSTVSFRQIDRSGVPTVNGLGLWTNSASSALYKWGGARGYAESIGDAGKKVLWEFEADGSGGGTWSQKTVLSSSAWDYTWQNAFGASASCDNDYGFFVGGQASRSTDAGFNQNSAPVPVPGILSYNIKTREWKNSSTKALNSPSGTFQQGSAVCTKKFTKNPLVFVLGGESTSTSSVDQSSNVGLDKVSFFDPIESRWYHQTTKGDIPKDRLNFCAVGVESPNGTYEIYVYGGRNAEYGRFNDVYILSLPGFQWFRANITSPTRANHACALVGKRQMLVLGGLSEKGKWSEKDPWQQALGILDLPSMEWKNQYDPELGRYQSPLVVQQWYKNGGLSNVNWDNEDVGKIFSNDTTTGSSESPRLGNSKRPVGAIVGGAVAGALVVLVTIGVYIWTRRRRMRRAAHIDPHARPELANNTLQIPYYKPELDACASSRSPSEAWTPTPTITPAPAELDGGRPPIYEVSQ